MKKIVFSLMVIAAFCCLTCSYAYDVKSVSQLMSLFDSQSQGTVSQTINLLVDLDFSVTKLTFPLGRKTSGTCVSFSGVLNGNGHTIRGLEMDNKEKTSYSNAGLFCVLENATVNDLVIDRSCSFVGKGVGALAVTVSGSVNLRNVISHASVTGETDIGGFLGLIQKTNRATVSLENCANYGSVTGTYFATQNRVGGMIGFARDNTNLAINVYDSINSATLTCKSGYCGGFIGYFFNNSAFTVEMSGCDNNGNVNGNRLAGGFIGGFWSNDNGEITLLKAANYGNVSGLKMVGGVLGSVSGGKDLRVNVFKCKNTGFISGLDLIGGLVGSVSTQSQAGTVFTIKHCNNLGNVNANSDYSCGIFCVDTSENNALLTAQVLNTVNKGTITGISACGISNNPTGAIHAVNIGVVENSTTCFSLWSAIRQSTTRAYALNTTCVNCGTAPQFGKSPFNGLYYLIGSSSVRMDEKLTKDAKGSGYDCVWTSKLEVVEKYFTVSIGAPVGLAVYVSPSSSLDSIEVLAPYFSDKYVLYDSENASVRYGPKTLVTADTGIEIVQLVDVTIGAPVNTVVRLAPGSLLGDINVLQPYFVSKYAIVDSQNKNVVFNKNTTVLQDMSVSIINKVRVVIKMTPISSSIVNETKIINMLSDFTNKSFDNFSLDFITDDDGNVAQIYVYVFDEETANQLVDAIRNINKEECSFGILCEYESVFIEEPEPSLSSFISISSFVFIFSSILFIMMA